MAGHGSIISKVQTHNVLHRSYLANHYFSITDRNRCVLHKIKVWSSNDETKRIDEKLAIKENETLLSKTK